MTFSKCNDCPRQCSADRKNAVGLCGVGNEFRVARIAPHAWEEPPVSGKHGSGTVFFSGCNLGCVFCQNRDISRGKKGKDYTSDRLLDEILAMVEKHNVHNINLVTPTHYSTALIPLLEKLRERNSLPVVWNSSGYESVATLRRLDGLVDVYLPDFKYASEDAAGKYSKAADYPAVASAAVAEMHRQVGSARFSEDGLITRGLIVRHLVLPGERQDSLKVLETVANILPIKDIRLSLMSQYTPDFALDSPYSNLHRRLTAFEYDSVLKRAIELGFEGYFQGRSSAQKSYTPDF